MKFEDRAPVSHETKAVSELGEREAGKTLSVTVVVLAAAILVGVLATSARDSEAYSWYSNQYYLADYNHNAYAYRTTSFDWQGWQGPYVAITRIGFGARISGVGYSMYGWMMAFEPTIDGMGQFTRFSGNVDPNFAMDINNGWVTRNQYNLADSYGQSPTRPTTAWAFTCHDANECAPLTTAINFSMSIGGSVAYQGTTGYLSTQWTGGPRY